MAFRANQLRLASLCLLAALVLPQLANAVDVSGLYDVQLPVDGRGEAERQQTFARALEQVLTRVTGDPQAAERAAAKRLLSRASRFVQQYRYREAEESDSGQELWVRFDRASLKGALRETGLPVWGAERPAVLLWLAVESDGERVLVGEDTAPRSRDVLQAVAEQRGIPLMLPLLDVEDRRAVDVADVVGGFDEPIRQASRRYNPDMVLAAHARGRGANWRAQWRLSLNEPKLLTWETKGASLEAVLRDGMQALANKLAERLALTSDASASASTILTVEDVDDLQDYARVEHYLSKLGPVRAYRPQTIEPGRASFWIGLEASSADLARVIELGGTLKRLPEPVRPDDSAAVQRGLRFRLAR